MKRITLLGLFILLVWIFNGSVGAGIAANNQVVPLSESGYERAFSLAFSQDGQILAVGGLSGIYLFDTASFSRLNFLETNTWARSLVFLPGSNLLAAGLFDQRIVLWDTPESQPVLSLDGHQGWVRSVATSADGRLLLSAGDDATLRLWQMPTGQVLRLIENISGLRAAALSPDGALAAGSLSDNSVRIWDTASGNLIQVLEGHSDWVRCLAFSPDGRWLASAGFDKTILLWDTQSWRIAKNLSGHESSVLGLAFSPDGELIASGAVDRTVRVWSVEPGQLLHTLSGHQGFVYAVAFSPDGKTLVSGGADNTLRLWSLAELDATANTDVATQTPSDCRVCHHRRSTLEPAPVIEMSCESCHPGGASLAWCTNFPRAVVSNPIAVAYHPSDSQAGVPVNSPDLAVEIAAPSNGETLYVRGEYLVPETVSGSVYYGDHLSIDQVELQLEILSEGQVTSTGRAQPSPDGKFSFAVDLNPGSLQAQSPTLFCRGCHEKTGSGLSFPVGEVQIVVTAKTPAGQIARDTRWIKVDASQEAHVSFQVVDVSTQEPVPGLIVNAQALIYEWRSRSTSALTDESGLAQAALESLSQSPTHYTISVPSQVVGGLTYRGVEPVSLLLEPSPGSLPTLQLAVIAEKAPAVQPAHAERSEVLQPAGPAEKLSLVGKIRQGLLKAGLTALQVTTFSVYVIFIAGLVLIPLGLLLYKKFTSKRD